MKTIKFIVGDCFGHFINDAETESLAKILKGDNAENTDYLIGQGISMNDLELIKLNNPKVYESIKNRDIVKKNKQIAHKCKVENCHITIPTKVSDTEYHLNILIDSGCCELSDHITGEHINGVILIEAVRQAFIAVTEAFFLAPEDKTYFIMKELRCEFLQFLFPLPIQMRYKILSHVQKAKCQLDFSVSTELYHVENEKACVINGVFSVYPKKMMVQLESELAKNSLTIFK
jgi:hypothetical protein